MLLLPTLPALWCVPHLNNLFSMAPAGEWQGREWGEKPPCNTAERWGSQGTWHMPRYFPSSRSQRRARRLCWNLFVVGRLRRRKIVFPTVDDVVTSIPCECPREGLADNIKVMLSRVPRWRVVSRRGTCWRYRPEWNAKLTDGFVPCGTQGRVAARQDGFIRDEETGNWLPGWSPGGEVRILKLSNSPPIEQPQTPHLPTSRSQPAPLPCPAVPGRPVPTSLLSDLRVLLQHIPHHDTPSAGGMSIPFCGRGRLVRSGEVLALGPPACRLGVQLHVYNNGVLLCLDPAFAHLVIGTPPTHFSPHTEQQIAELRDIVQADLLPPPTTPAALPPRTGATRYYGARKRAREAEQRQAVERQIAEKERESAALPSFVREYLAMLRMKTGVSPLVLFEVKDVLHRRYSLPEPDTVVHPPCKHGRVATVLPPFTTHLCHTEEPPPRNPDETWVLRVRSATTAEVAVPCRWTVARLKDHLHLTQPLASLFPFRVLPDGAPLYSVTTNKSVLQAVGVGGKDAKYRGWWACWITSECPWLPTGSTTAPVVSHATFPWFHALCMPEDEGGVGTEADPFVID
eukprot:Sspe_Gene.10894::Locus_3674_Transcript_1_1_Confidence_1.000_Length_1937::g.10894::m.10894